MSDRGDMMERMATAETAEMVARHRDEGRATWFVNGLVTTKATAAETGRAYALAEHLVSAASNPPVHVHTDEDEAYYVLDGEMELEVGGVTTVARPGTYALAPHGRPHTFRVLTDTARVLVITSSPCGATAGNFERFVETVGVSATAPVLPVPEPPDPVALTAAAAACKIEIVPPSCSTGGTRASTAIPHPARSVRPGWTRSAR
jgi:mannose-6-phosphate isomerase-like protein (cupin superfamily)